MELLLSNFGKAKYPSHSTTRKVWDKNLGIADNIKIATGFISSDSLIELAKIIELNDKPNIELLIGMHYFSGFTKAQYDSAIALHNILEEKKRGAVYISTSTMFHGKLYSFADSQKSYGALVGSSNLGSMVKSSSGLYEADCYFNDDKNIKQVDHTISNLVKDIGIKISDVSIDSFNKHNVLLDNHYGVDHVQPEDLVKIWSTKTDLVFDVPVKTEAKSNLNIFFGRGRVSSRGFEVPRPWYEAEFIVPVEITRLPNYPKERVLTIYTDDGWSFECSSQGQNAKNFRSLGDLQILGRWIKGKLELSGALQIGQPVTADVLNKYGNDTVKLLGTSNPDIWLLDYGTN
ncbi:restriction endonuclease PLD domain-containing protein [uncultured Alistipes sp.]|uniref:restriction endonuclease PLD domain-containing protein n=1 Tax=uncultured Alistipes sp. TaxID=538949 RepID=UPI0025DBE30C|nr:restriction endonuclease PLD domain-containing protein [uncultured Alistipes sp.]